MTENLVDSARTGEQARPSWGGLQYDHRSSKVKVDPYNLWSRLRKECPVLHSDNYGGFWFVSRYEDTKRILTEPESFSAAQGVTLPREPMTMLPLEADPPAQRQYREILNPHLTPATVQRYEDFARSLARAMLAQALPAGQIDLAHFAEAYGHTVVMRALGFEESDLNKLDTWCAVLFSAERETEVGHRAGAELMEFMNAALEARAGAGARDDLLSAVANGDLGDRPVDRGEQLSMVSLLVFGGFHTTGSTLTSALVWLADHPADVERLRAEPELMPVAVEEFVRYASPISHMRRTTTRDVVVSGCPIPAGEAVQFGLASANHDETVFEAPEEVILDRRPNRHLGFGSGPHRCVGSHLGKLAIRVGLEEFFAAVARVEVEDHGALRYFASEGRGIIYAPALITPRQSSEN
jgi:cytochrome P450